MQAIGNGFAELLLVLLLSRQRGLSSKILFDLRSVRSPALFRLVLLWKLLTFSLSNFDREENSVLALQPQLASATLLAG